MRILGMDLSFVKLGILGMALITAVIHVYYWEGEVILLLNALGYLGLAGLFVLPQFRQWREPVRWTLIAYTVVTIVLYFALHPNGMWRHAIGLLTKVVEVVLILLLLFDRQLERSNV